MDILISFDLGLCLVILMCRVGCCLFRVVSVWGSSECVVDWNIVMCMVLVILVSDLVMVILVCLSWLRMLIVLVMSMVF